VVVDSLLHELINLFGDLLGCIKQCLLFVILPVECQVEYADRFPEIPKLSASSVDDSCDLVGDDKFKILNKTKTVKRTLFATYLCSQFIANEEPVLDLDHSDDVVVHHVISPEILLCESVILRKLVVLKVSLLLGWRGASELLLLRRN
jgi:hypothetical protein